jgi:tight adherence protein B
LSLNSETGGPVVEIMNNLGASLREKNKIEKKMLALTAEPRISARIVTGIPVVLIVMQMLKSPEQIRFLLNDPSGKGVLMYAAISILLGLIWIKRLTKV